MVEVGIHETGDEIPLNRRVILILSKVKMLGIDSVMFIVVAMDTVTCSTYCSGSQLTIVTLSDL